MGRKRPATAARPAEVPDGVWQDFQAIRKAKRAPLTDTALDGIRREAEKAGLGLADAIAYCCEAGWQGFNAGWYSNRKGGAVAGGRPGAPVNKQEALEQRNREVAAGWMPPELRGQQPGVH